MSAEDRTYAESKGWKGDTPPDALLSSYKNLEKVWGADKAGRALMLPKDANDTAALDAIYDKLGRPADPSGYEITLPEGVELTVPKNVGSCVEASTALGKLNLSLLGATSTADIDDSAAQLKEVLGTDAAKDVDEVAKAARKAAESGTISPGAYNDDAYNAANAALAKRITTLCSEG